MRSLLLGLLAVGTIPVSSSAIAESWLSQLPQDSSKNNSHNICLTSSPANCGQGNLVAKINLRDNLWFMPLGNFLFSRFRLDGCWHQSTSIINHSHRGCLLSANGLLNPYFYSRGIGIVNNSVSVFNSENKVRSASPFTTSLQQLPRLSRSSLIVPSSRNLTSLCSTVKAASSSCLAGEELKLANPAPATERIASSFGWRRRPYSGQRQFHQGIDYGAPLGTPVVAAANGIVIEVVSGCTDFGNRFCGSQFGNWVQIDHGNGRIATYAHLLNKSIIVKKGMKVWKNQKIAQVGSSGWSTGAHLDFRLQVNGQYQNPADYVTAIAE